MSELQGATLTRRMLAILYDSLALLGVLAAGTLTALAFTGGEAIAPGNPWLRLWLLALTYGYFVVSWRKGGQTLGMRAWKIRVVADDGRRASWAALSARFAAAVVSWAALGLGFLSAWRRPRRAWHDRWSRTYLISAVPT